MMVTEHSYVDTLRALGARARALRLLDNLRQDELATRAGIGVATVQRFERTGSASLENVLRIATALRAEAAFEALFAPPPYTSLDEVLARPAATRRLSVRRRA